MTDATIAVRLQPGAQKDELTAIRRGVLVIRVRAPPLDGRANQALCEFLADRLDVRSSRVTVVRGVRSRDKLVRVADLDQGTVDATLGL